MKRIKIGREDIPLRSVLQQKDTAKVSLWREASISEHLQLGSSLRVSHLKPGRSHYGSTNFKD